MKKILFAIAAVAVSAGAHASYLYWQIDGTSEDVSALSGATFDGARVFVSSDGGASDKTYLEIGYADPDLPSGYQSVGYVANVPQPNMSLVAVVPDNAGYDGANYSFYIELVNYNSTLNSSQTDSGYGTSDFVGQSEGQSYANLAAHDFVGSDLSPVNMAVWHGGAYSPVPEPTSAMLVLFGLAGLALRRRAV